MASTYKLSSIIHQYNSLTLAKLPYILKIKKEFLLLFLSGFSSPLFMHFEWEGLAISF